MKYSQRHASIHGQPNAQNRQLSMKFPFAQSLILLNAKRHARRGELKKAIEICEEVLTGNPDNVRTQTYLKSLKVKLSKQQETRSVSPRDELKQLVQLFERQKFMEILDRSKTLEFDHRDSPVLPEILGAANLALGRLKPAVEHLERAVALQSDNFIAQNNLGKALLESGDTEKAILSFKAAISAKPDYVEALYNLANAFSALGRNGEAIESYREALKLKPNFALAHNNLGNALRTSGRAKEAVEAYNSALNLDRTNAEAHYNLGKTHIELKQPNEAIQSFKKSLRIKPDLALAHNGLGEAYWLMDEFRQAVESYRKAVELNPKFAEAFANLGSLYHFLEMEEAARHYFQKAVELNPELAEARHFLSALEEKDTTQAPRDYVVRAFDNYADSFEEHLVKNLEYGGPKILKDLILKNKPEDLKFVNGIDLGCGTGLAGVQFREFVEFLAGVDLSERMVEKASGKDVYDELRADEMIAGLESFGRKFDLFVSADVLVYVGDLSSFFSGISRNSEPLSYVTVSTEHMEGKDYKLLKSGRYSHSNHYVVRTAEKHGFELIDFKVAPLRREMEAVLSGGYYVFRRSKVLNGH